MRNTSDERLLEIYAVQGLRYSGVAIIVHITEHFSHHTGQIIFWTKQLTGKDLGFYSHVDLNKKNKS
jgi:uncharacterized damage-inducible protein DinB